MQDRARGRAADTWRHRTPPLALCPDAESREAVGTKDSIVVGTLNLSGVPESRFAYNPCLMIHLDGPVTVTLSSRIPPSLFDKREDQPEFSRAPPWPTPASLGTGPVSGPFCQLRPVTTVRTPLPQPQGDRPLPASALATSPGFHVPTVLRSREKKEPKATWRAGAASGATHPQEMRGCAERHLGRVFGPSPEGPSCLLRGVPETLGTQWGCPVAGDLGP